MRHVIETKKQKIYFNTYYYVLENLQDAITRGIDYQQICFSDFEEFFKMKYFNEDILYLKKNDSILEFYYFNNDLLQVRSKMFDLLQIIKKSLKDRVGIYSFETISYENSDEVYHIGLIDNDLKYINICDVKIVVDDEVIHFVLTIDDALINHILKTLDKGELVHSNFVPHLFGVVLLDENRIGVKKRYNELIEYLKECNFTVLKANSETSAKEQYTYLEKECVRWIIEVNYRKYKANMIKLKNVFLNEIIDIPDGKEHLSEMLYSLLFTNNEDVYKNYLNNYLKYQKTENIDIICNTCIDNYLKMGYNFVKPLSNAVSNGKCKICNSKAIHKFFRL